MTHQPSYRTLTPGEVRMARTLFADAINYDKVRIYARPYLWFGLQKENVAMAPNGHIYFGSERCKEDFSIASSVERHWFMHEMTHVWQHQLGYALRFSGIRLHLFQRWLRQTDPYLFSLTPESRLSHFNMEQQACIVADYYSVLNQLSVFSTSGHLVRNKSLLAKTLCDFLDDPKDTRSLPTG